MVSLKGSAQFGDMFENWYDTVSMASFNDVEEVHGDFASAVTKSSAAAAATAAASAAATVLSTYTSGASGGYNIQINFKGTWTADLQKGFIESANKLSSLITGDIANVSVRGRLIDDISIDATLTAIDGVGGVLGQAGATAVRTTGYLPATAIMQFDSADAKSYLASGQWGTVVQHEMIHSIGFSSGIWAIKGLISGAGTATPMFTGKGAAVTYNKIYGTKGNVPLEQDGGAGTRDSHWDEQRFGSELMTGWINKGANNFSPMTLAAIEDMGYDTVWKASDYIV